MVDRKAILQLTERAIMRDRNMTHGKPEDTFKMIADLWSVYLRIKVTPSDVAIMQGLLKIARSKHNPTNADNYVDLAGYAACAAEVAGAV